MPCVFFQWVVGEAMLLLDVRSHKFDGLPPSQRARVGQDAAWRQDVNHLRPPSKMAFPPLVSSNVAPQVKGSSVLNGCVHYDNVARSLCADPVGMHGEIPEFGHVGVEAGAKRSGRKATRAAVEQ